MHSSRVYRPPSAAKLSDLACAAYMQWFVSDVCQFPSISWEFFIAGFPCLLYAQDSSNSGRWCCPTRTALLVCTITSFFVSCGGLYVLPVETLRSLRVVKPLQAEVSLHAASISQVSSSSFTEQFAPPAPVTSTFSTVISVRRSKGDAGWQWCPSYATKVRKINPSERSIFPCSKACPSRGGKTLPRLAYNINFSCVSRQVFLPPDK